MTTDRILALLDATVERVRDDKPDLVQAGAVVPELGRLAFAGRPEDLAAGQAVLARLRERLGEPDDDGPAGAVAILGGQDGTAFLAGALWAMDEVLTTRIDELDRRIAEAGSRPRRSELRQVVLQVLTEHPSATPTQILRAEQARGLQIRPDEISRTLGELLGESLVAPADPPSGSDRRRKYYRLTDQARADLDVVDRRVASLAR